MYTRLARLTTITTEHKITGKLDLKELATNFQNLKQEKLHLKAQIIIFYSGYLVNSKSLYLSNSTQWIGHVANVVG